MSLQKNIIFDLMREKLYKKQDDKYVVQNWKNYIQSIKSSVTQQTKVDTFLSNMSRMNIRLIWIDSLLDDNGITTKMYNDYTSTSTITLLSVIVPSKSIIITLMFLKSSFSSIK